MSELASAIVAINAQLPSARGGLPEELFLLASRLIPMINVNLLIRDEAGRTLLTWRADCFYGPGWHIPGGIIRFKEPIAERIEAVVHTELGAGVGFEPLTMTEIFADHRDVRGHFISLLYTCRLTTPPDPVLACDGQPTPGCWQWFDRCPENIIEVHKRVSHLISPAQGTRPNYSVKPERGIMNQAAKIETPQGAALTADEQAKRNQLMARKPYVAKKLARISEMEARGEVSPIIRLEKSYLCNFQCTHCSAEYYMDRHLDKVLHVTDARQKMDLEDVRRLSREADELGLARFVITGGEPLVMKDFDDVVAALDPEKHYIVTDTNGWFLDLKRAQHLKEIGVEKVQLSLDSMIEANHDNFRNKPGSYKRVMRAVDACMEAGLNLILSTVLVKGRAQTEEFREMCKFVTDRGIGLYVSYAKPTGSCTDHPEFVINKADADAVRKLERDYNVFTHMTPSYGSRKGCITVKGIITVTSTMEVTPCPYIDFSLGNLRETPLKEVLQRGLHNPWLGPYRPDCLIGEDQQFIKIHTEKTRNQRFLPLPWGKGFSDHDSLMDMYEGEQEFPTQAQCDGQGRLLPNGVTAPANPVSRHYFRFACPELDYAAIHARTASAFGAEGLPDAAEFQARAEAVLAQLREDVGFSGLLDGTPAPFLLPTASHADVGGALTDRYLPAVAKGFTEAYPKQEFKSPFASDLSGKLSVVAEGRHQRLIEAMANGPVVGWYIPCLQEYSIPAAIERVAALPKRFLLAGGYDSCAVLIGNPGLVVNCNHYPPLLWLAGLAGEAPGVGYHFEAYGQDLLFNRRAHRGQLSEFWNSAIVVLG